MTDLNEFSSIVIKGFPFIKVVSDPNIMSCCDSGKRIRAYSKDFARMVGPDMQVVNRDAWEAEQALLGHSVSSMARELRKIPMTGALDRMGGQHPALNAVIGRNAVLVKGVGAVCAGRTESDAEAVAAAVSRNCEAACNIEHAKPLGMLESRLQRYKYIYGSLKSAGDRNEE